MRILAAGLLVLGCAAAAAAQPSLAEQALQHLGERPGAPETNHDVRAPAPREAEEKSIAAFTLAALKENGAGDAAVVRTGKEAAAATAGNIHGLLVIVPVGLVLAAGLFFSRRRALNYGLRYSRALVVGIFGAGVWTWATFPAEPASLSASSLTVTFFVIPAVLVWSLPLLVTVKELLLEHPTFRRWFLFERGGSARWAGPRHYRAYARAFTRRRDPEEGYTNG